MRHTEKHSLISVYFQGNLKHEYTGSNCVPLDGPGVRQELIGLLRYLRLFMFFSKKPYEVFLEFGGYGQSDILIRKSKSQVCITLSQLMFYSIHILQVEIP